MTPITELGCVSGADCTVAFQAAINSGVGLEVPPGRYLLSSTIALKSGLIVTGCGSASVFVRVPGSVGDMFAMSNGGGVRLRDFVMDGNRAECPGGGSNVLFTDVSDSEIAGCEILNAKGQGIRWLTVANSRIVRNKISGAGDNGIRVSGSSGHESRNIHVVDNQAVSNGADSPGPGTPGIGIAIAWVKRGIVRGNHALTNKTNGIDINSCAACILEGNVSLSNGLDGFAPDGGPGDNTDIVIVGNTSQYNGGYGINFANRVMYSLVALNNLRGNVKGPKYLGAASLRVGTVIGTNVE